jgi:hypothetical protein
MSSKIVKRIAKSKFCPKKSFDLHEIQNKACSLSPLYTQHVRYSSFKLLWRKHSGMFLWSQTFLSSPSALGSVKLSAHEEVAKQN